MARSGWWQYMWNVCRAFAVATALAGAGTGRLCAQEPPGQGKREAPVLSAEMKDALSATKSGEWKRAAALWAKVTEKEPANAGAWANRGTAQFQNKDAKGAIASLEKAVGLTPSLSEAWVSLGMAYYEEQAPMRAVSCLTRAVHENPQDARTRNALAIMLKRVGWGGAAETELQKALDLDPKYAEAHFNLAVLYLERRPPMPEMARRHYEAARALGAARDSLLEDQLAEKPLTDEGGSHQDAEIDQPQDSSKKRPDQKP